MPNEIQSKFGGSVVLNFSTFLNSLASGEGALCLQIDNSTLRAPKILVYCEITTSGLPTDGSQVKLYLIRDDSNAAVYRSEGYGVVAANKTVEPTNALPVGAVTVTGAAGAMYSDFVVLDPGEKWALLVWNATGQVLAASTNFVHYQTVIPEVQ